MTFKPIGLKSNPEKIWSGNWLHVLLFLLSAGDPLGALFYWIVQFMFWITSLAKCQRLHKDYYWKGSHCSQASPSFFIQEDHWKLSRFAGKNRSAKCIVHRLQFEILCGSSLTCLAPLETYLDRMGSHFCSTSAQRWLPRKAHFSIKNRNPISTAVPVWNVNRTEEKQPEVQRDQAEAQEENSQWQLPLWRSSLRSCWTTYKKNHISRGNIILQHNPALWA